MAITIQYQGEKDYSDIIQSALDKGGTIFVKSGYYTISKTLLISSSIQNIFSPIKTVFISEVFAKTELFKTFPPQKEVPMTIL